MTRTATKTSMGQVPYRDNSSRAILGDLFWTDIEQLKTPKSYARKRTQQADAMLRGALETYEILSPAIVDEDNVILDGVARVEQAKALGYAQYPVFRVSHLSPALKMAFSIAVNKIPSRNGWDREQLYANIDAILLEQPGLSVETMGFTVGELDALRIEVVGENADDELSEPGAPVSRLGDLWLLGNHRLLCGSSFEAAAWVQLMAGKIAAMMFSDPPYNVPIAGHVSGLGKVKHRDFQMGCGELDSDGFTDFLKRFIDFATDHLKDGAVLQICMDWKHQWELLSAARQAGLTQLNLCVWNKTNGGLGSLYRSKHELVGIFKHGKAPHTNCVELGRHGRYRANVWDYAGANSFGRGRMKDLADHPTVKPTALVADAICDVSIPGEIVIDPFMGSGTTILAADRVHRVAYGIELEPAYVDVAIRRWQECTGREAVLESSGRTFADVAAARLDPTASSEIPPLLRADIIAPPSRRRAA